MHSTTTSLTKSYEPRVAPMDAVRCGSSARPAGEVVHDVEPETTAGQRALIEMLQALPIDWLL